MYRQHFGLEEHPFTSEIEPEDLFPADAVKELEVRLSHVLDMRGIGLVTGDAGSARPAAPGRSSLGSIPRFTVFSRLRLNTGNVMDLYKTISWEMGLPVERSGR